MMEMTTQPYYSKSVAKCNLERKDGVEVNSKTSSSITHQEEKAARSLERDVMVERVSSTTEHHSWRTSQKQQRAEMSSSTEMMLGAKTLSKKRPREEKDKHSGTPCKEETQHRSHKSKHQSSSRGREKSVRREHSRSKSISRRNETLQYSTSSKRHSEREAKGADPEVSSSSLVLVLHGRAVPPPPRIGPLSGRDDRKHNSLPHTEKERSSKPHVGKDDKYKDKSKQNHYKERDKETRHKDKRTDTSPHFSGSKKSTIYERMVELQVREIRNNLEKISREVLETREEPTSKSVHSESRHEKYRELREGQDTQDTLVGPFLPSSRCCSPPPRPTEITKYWSDADETEDESDTEKHMMHVNSVNIVLNYMKAHSDKYYEKGREPVSQNKDGETVKPKGSIKERLTFLSQSSSPWRGSKGEHVKKQGNFDRGRKMHSRHPAKQRHAGPFVQENVSPTREQYDCHSRLGSSSTELSTVVLDLLASLSDQQSRLPSRFAQQQRRSSHSPLQLGEGRSSQLHSTHRDGESYSPRYERRSLRRESCSPLRQKSDSLRNRGSHSPSRYRDDRGRNRLSHSPSRYRDDRGRNRQSPSPSRYRDDRGRNRLSHSPSRCRDDFVRDRESHSPSRHRGDPLRNRGSRSPSRNRGDSLRNRASHSPGFRRNFLGDNESPSPSRHRGDSLRDIESHTPRFGGNTLRDRESHTPGYRGDSRGGRKSHSPSSFRSDFLRDNESHTTSRYRGDSLRDRESHTPGYRGDSLRDKESHTPGYRGDSLRDKESHTPGYRGDSLRDKESHTPLYRGDSLRDRESHTPRYISDFLREKRLQNVSFIREKETLVLSDREFYPSVSERPPLRTSPELQLSHAQLREPHFSHELSQRNHSRSPSSRNHCRTQQNNEKNAIGNSDYFFNPAVEDDEDCLEDSKPCPEKDQMQKGEGQFTESGSLSCNSIKGTNTSAPVAAAHVNDPKLPDDVIKSQLCDSNNQRNFTPRSQTQIFAVGSEPTIGQPEDFYLEESSTNSRYHQPSFVPNTNGRQLLTGQTELNEPNLPGPSGVSSAASSGIRDVNDPPYWLSDSDHDSDLEDFDNCLSEVSTLIADHEAATSDKTPSNAGSVVTVPIEHEAVTTQSARQEQEKECLTLNSAEMTTLLSLIEIAKQHTATGDDLSNNLPRILDKIRKTTTISKNDSETSGGQNGDKKKRPNMPQGSGGMQDSTMDAGSSRGTSSGGNVKNVKSNNIQRGNKGAAPSCNEATKQLSKDKISKKYAVKKLSGTKDSKSQQRKDTLQAGKGKGKPSAGEKQLKAEGNSQLQQKKSKLQEKKANDNPSVGKTQVQSWKKKASDIPLQENEINKEKPLKNKGIVSRKKSECKNHSGRGATDNISSVIEKTFANMQCVRIYVGDLPASTESVAKSNTSLKSPKKRPFKQLDEKLLVKYDFDSINASESPEAKESKDTLLPPDDSPQTVHPLHQETIVLDHSVDICLACKHKLVPDEYTSISLSTGTVTMRCRICCTFMKMEKVMPQGYFENTSDLKTKTLQKKSTCSITSEVKKTLHSSKGIQKTINKEKNVTPTSTKRIEKMTKSVSNKFIPKITSTSKVLQDKEGKKLKTLTNENKTSTSASKSKASISREDKEESSSNFDSIDPSLQVFPWSSNRKRKKVHEDLKLSDDSSDSVEDVIKPIRKRPTKRKRIIKSPFNSEDEDDTSRLAN
ncbi:uncharacterized protein LOC126998064 [Eriocheir sinensis]|uniref:uncharacterized protein LOC126998064 n=1 Tax=Eriocheir sinensis TaxID=95602 RepID=UPI0021C6D7FE|nr:uncharacterized protein LOC126998064 [Eriocheir sinensis]